MDVGAAKAPTIGGPKHATSYFRYNAATFIKVARK
jgi:hypothetical protein